VVNVKKKPWLPVRVEQMGMFRRRLRTTHWAGGRLVCVFVCATIVFRGSLETFEGWSVVPVRTVGGRARQARRSTTPGQIRSDQSGPREQIRVSFSHLTLTLTFDFRV
jgi:hypothetical protein